MKLTQKNLLDLHITCRYLHENALTAYTAYNLSDAATEIYLRNVRENIRDLSRILDTIENQE